MSESGGSIDPPFIEAELEVVVATPLSGSGGSIDPPFIEACAAASTEKLRSSLADQLIRPSLKLAPEAGRAGELSAVWRIN